jgi:hypothetical protein
LLEESDRHGIPDGSLLGGALIRVQSLIGGCEHGLRLVARSIFLPTDGVLNGKFATFPDHFD